MDSENSPYTEVRLDFNGGENSPMGFNRKKTKQRRQSTIPGSGSNMSGGNSFNTLLKRQN